jgi:hypothetical protein
MENMQQNMEAALRSIADNTHRGVNPGGHEVNQYSSFKDFMDTRPPIFKEAAEFRVLRMQKSGLTQWKTSFVF